MEAGTNSPPPLPPRLLNLLNEHRRAGRFDLLSAGLVMLAFGLGNVPEPSRIAVYLQRELGITSLALILMLVICGAAAMSVGVLTWNARPRVWLHVVALMLNTPLIFLALFSIPAVLEHEIPILGFISYWVMFGLNTRLCRVSFQIALFAWYWSADDADA